jgi:hypothetical protein
MCRRSVEVKELGGKCIRVKANRVKMVVGQDVSLVKVEGMMNMVLVKIFMEKFVKSGYLKFWFGEN